MLRTGEITVPANLATETPRFLWSARCREHARALCFPSAAASLLDAASRQAFASFLEVLDDDARKAQAALRSVLAQKPIRSQLVDNLNASIHLRAPLTDIFLIDEALKRGEG